MKRLPIRVRLTIASTSLMLVALALAGGVLYSRFESGLLAAVDGGLHSRADTLLAGVGSEDMAFGDGGSLIAADGSFAQILSRDGEVLDATEVLPPEALLGPEALANLDGARTFDWTLVLDGEPVAARLLVAPSQAGPIVVVGTSLEDQRVALSRLAALLWLGIPAVVAMSALVGWWLAGAALRPIERMRAEASAISAGDIDHRLRVEPNGDEVARLGETLNGLLERLQGSIERERRFVEDASHELRTPLGNLKTEIELALRSSRSSEELEAALRSAGDESDRVIRLAEDLLVLARAERGKLPIRRSPTDLGRLTDEVVASFSTSAATSGVEIRRTGNAAPIAVDPVRLRQVMGNLISNAVRHSKPGQVVQVRLSERPEGTAIAVEDAGEGFPAAFIEHAFEPFTSADAGRSRAGGGTGLGLAIVRTIVEAHGGSARAENRPGGGGTVTVTLPVGARG